jgi:chemotaxis methyl-accepting protein methylase
MAALGNIIIPRIAEQGRTFQALDAGCSNGSDTVSFAATLAANGIDFHIDGVDINSRVLALATQPHPATREDLVYGIAQWGGTPPEAINYFESTDADHVRPTPELLERITFKQADIGKPLPDTKEYDLVAINNVLMHYAPDVHQPEPPEIHAILTNLTDRLAVGGLFTYNGSWTKSPEETEEILSHHHLTPLVNTYGIPDEQWKDIRIYEKVPDTTSATRQPGAAS